VAFVSLRSFPAMLVSLFFAGLGFGSYYPIGVSMLSETFHGRSLGTVIGLHETGAPIGSTVGPFVASLLLLSQFDWRSSLMLGLVAVPFILVLLSVTIRRDHPMRGSGGVGFKIRSRSNYALIVVFAICVVGLDAGLTSMIPVYMVDVLKVGNSETALVYGATRFFGVVGIIISGFLSDRINKSTIIVVMVSLATSASVAIALLPYNAFFIIALAILATAFSSYWPVLMTMMSEISSNENLPKVIGFQRLANGLLGGGLTPLVIGYLADIIDFRTAFAYPIALGALGVITAVLLRTRRN
jgi:MFS family permease